MCSVLAVLPRASRGRRRVIVEFFFPASGHFWAVPGTPRRPGSIFCLNASWSWTGLIPGSDIDLDVTIAGRPVSWTLP